MKKTVFFMVLAVLVLIWFPTLIEAKFIAEKLVNNWYRITEIPDPPVTKELPPLPSKIKLNQKEVAVAYQLSLSGQSYLYTEEVSITITSVLPVTFKKNLQVSNVFLVKNNNGTLNWNVKPGSKKQGMPNIKWFMTLMLLLMIFGILFISIYDRRFGKRKTISLFGFYLATIIISILEMFSPLIELGAPVVLLLCLTVPIIASIMILPLIKENKKSPFPALFVVINFLVSLEFYLSFFQPNQQITHPSELLTLFVLTIVISFLIGEGWYYRHKNQHIAVSETTQTT